MECKLKKATLNFEVTIKQMEADAVSYDLNLVPYNLSICLVAQNW